MKKVIFARPNCPACPANYNRGHAVEWKIGYELTGTPARANNHKGADVEGWQIKSPKASVSDETESKGFIFGFSDENFFYEMSKEEFAEFLQEFSYIDKNSKTGERKIRIKNDTKKMRWWFLERV